MHVLLVANCGVAHHLKIAHRGSKHKVASHIAGAVETEAHQIVGKIDGMHAGTVVVSQVLRHPQVAEGLEGVGALIEDNIAVDALYSETFYGTHHAIDEIGHLGEMARSERGVAVSHHHEVALEMIVIDFAYGFHLGNEGKVGAEQFERRSRGDGLHGRSRDKRLMRCIGGNHRAGVEA